MNEEKCEHDGENPCGKCGAHWYIDDGTHITTREEMERVFREMAEAARKLFPEIEP